MYSKKGSMLLNLSIDLDSIEGEEKLCVTGRPAGLVVCWPDELWSGNWEGGWMFGSLEKRVSEGAVDVDGA